MGYILCRRYSLKEMGSCKVVYEEKHQMAIKKRKQGKVEVSIKWKLRKGERTGRKGSIQRTRSAKHKWESDEDST